MTAGLETFAKVRVLHDRTDNPGEKAAAAGRMEALARSAGMTVDEAVSKLDSAPTLAGADEDLLAAWKDSWAARAAGEAADEPDAWCWPRRGLPIYDPETIEPWYNVASHCLQIDWLIPKAFGGKFLTKDERARLKAIAQRGTVTNATADWIETVLSRCHTIREAWRDRSGLAGSGARPGRKAGESDIEWCARMVAAAKDRETSKVDTRRPEPEPQSRAQAAADSLNAFFNRPEFVAERQEREARRLAKAAEIIARHGSEDAVFEDTPMEAALRAACEPLLGPGETWTTDYSLDGWGSLATRHQMPASVREAATRAWPMPETVAAAWVEYEAADRLTGERCTVEYAYEPHLFAEARQQLLEEILNTAPALSLNDLRARGAWLDFWANRDVGQSTEEHRTVIATLRADIERMGQRLREQDAAPVQSGQDEQTPRAARSVSPCDATARNCAEAEPEAGAVQDGKAQGDPATAPPLSSPDLARSNAAAGFSPDLGETSAPVQSGHVNGAQDRHPTLTPCETSAENSAGGGRETLPPLRRTNADKRRDVLALLGRGLTDREIARRAGVSPQTVGNIRKGQP